MLVSAAAPDANTLGIQKILHARLLVALLAPGKCEPIDNGEAIMPPDQGRPLSPDFAGSRQGGRGQSRWAKPVSAVAGIPARKQGTSAFPATIIVRPHRTVATGPTWWIS